MRLFQHDRGKIYTRKCSTNLLNVGTNFVLAESHALILVRLGRTRALDFLRATITGSTNVIRAAEEDERRAREIIEQYQDKDFSYCDAMSFAVMERLDLQEAIAFDDHFRQYGAFTIL